MKDTKFRILLDIHEVRSQATIPVKVGDVSCKIYITLVEGGKPYKIHENSFGVFTGKKGDDNYLFNNCVIENGIIRYDFTPQTVAAAGVLECEIRIYDEDGGVLTTPSFNIIVDERAVNDSELASSDEFSFLDEILVNEGQRIQNEKNRNEAYNNIDIDVEDSADYVIVKKTNKDGSQEEVVIAKGKNSVSPEHIVYELNKDSKDSTVPSSKSVVKYTNNVAAELSQEIAVERARITNLATLKEGSTTGDTELTDARVGADGTVYPNVGDAVRSQVGNLKKSMVDIVNGEELLNNVTLLEKKYVAQSGGWIGTFGDNTFSCTDFISIPIGTTKIVHNYHSSGVGGWAFYENTNVNESGTPTSFIIWGNSEIIENIPSNARYIRLTDFNSELDHSDKYIRFDIGKKSYFRDKNFSSYGDSVTEMCYWQAMVYNYFGFATHNNCGKSGSCVSNKNGVLADDSEYMLCSDTSINRIPTDSDVITVMGGLNDYTNNIPIGDLSEPYNKSTFKGAYALMIQKLLTKFPTKLVLFMTLNSGCGTDNTNTTSYPKNELGLTVADYAQATREVLQYFGVKWVDMFTEDGITPFNRANYIQTDGLHPSFPAYALSNVVINAFKRIEPHNDISTQF